MENMSNVKRRLITSMISILLLVITIFGITYAYFTSRVKGNTTTKSAEVSAGKLELVYRDGNGLIEMLKIEPGVTLESKTFTVTNTGTALIDDYDVILEDVINELKYYEDLTYELTCTSSSGSCNGSNGVFPQSDDTIVTNSIDVGVTHTYTLTVTYNETNTDQSDDMNKRVSAKVNIIDEDAYAEVPSILVYGNSIQDGTPTPDNPVEIQSVGDKNLIIYPYYSTSGLRDGINWSVESDGTIKGTGTTTKGTNFYLFQRNTISLKAGTYTVSVKGKHKGMNLFLRNFDTNPLTTYVDIRSGLNDATVTFTINEDTSQNIMFYFNISYENTEVDIDCTVQLEEGSSATDYVPYGKYKIPIKLSGNGKNLFNSTFENVKIGSTGLNDGNSLSYVSSVEYIPVRPNTQYTFKVNNQDAIDSNGQFYTVEYDINKEFISGKRISHNNVIRTGDAATITTSNKTYYIRLFFYKNTTPYYEPSLEQFLLQIEEGDTATTYEPYNGINTTIYLDEPLRKVGDYADYIDFKNKKVVRNIKQIVLSGTEEWQEYSEVTNDYYISIADNPSSDGRYTILSKSTDYKTMLFYSTNLTNTDYATSIARSGNNLHIKNKDYSDVSSFKDYLANKYNNSNPVIINYVLATPIEETITIPSIAKIGNISNVSIGTTVQPSNIEIKR